MWWHTLSFPALGRQRQTDLLCEFGANIAKATQRDPGGFPYNLLQTILPSYQISFRELIGQRLGLICPSSPSCHGACPSLQSSTSLGSPLLDKLIQFIFSRSQQIPTPNGFTSEQCPPDAWTQKAASDPKATAWLPFMRRGGLQTQRRPNSAGSSWTDSNAH